MADNKTEEIKDKINLVEYIGQFVNLQNRSGRYMGCCPFHQEKTPSFSVDPDKGFYYCFGCQKHGDLFTFIMEYEKLTFPEALEKAAAKAGVTLEEGRRSSGANRDDRRKKEALVELHNRLTKTFHFFLISTPQGKRALEYVTERGINRDVIDTFKLGYAPSDPHWLFSFLRRKNYSPDFLSRSGLFSKRRAAFPLFRDRVIFPIFSLQGDSVAYSGRLLGGDGPKYINSPETVIFKKGKLLFAMGVTLPYIREKKEFILCEGNVDVLALFQAGCRNCLAPLGTALTEEQVKLLKRYADKGILLFDGDKAGMEATKKAAILCETYDIQLRAGMLPEKKDPSDILKEEGEESLKKIVHDSIQVFDFLLICAIRIVDANRPEGKSVIIKELAPYLRVVKSEIKRQAYLEKIADTLGLERKTVIIEYESRSEPAVRKRQIRKTVPEKMSDELYFALTLLANPDFIQGTLEEINSGEFTDMRAVKLIKLMEENKKSGINANDFLIMLDDSEPIFYYKEWLVKKEMTINVRETLKQGMGIIKRRNLEKRSREITVLLNKIGNDDDRIAAELLDEKIRIDRDIQNYKVK